MLSEFNGVWAFSENRDLMLELLGKGRELADKLQTELSALLMGYEVRDQASELICYGANRVYVVDNLSLKSFYADTYTSALTDLTERYKPEVLLIGSTKRGKELASRLTTRLEIGCVPDCIRLDIGKERQLLMSRLVYGGKAVAKLVCRTKPQVATVASRVFEKIEHKTRKGEVINVDVKLVEPKTELVETKKTEVKKVKLEDADVIVSGGRGIEKKEDFKMLEKLAKILGGVVGNTRPLSEDRRWFTEWIGLSGRKVAPSLYIACGVSGAIQHLAGIRDSNIIVAINKDEKAPIFEMADYMVVGDIYEVVSALTDNLGRRLKTS
jgi:electron transfer flavoprotein alpha subunit